MTDLAEIAADLRSMPNAADMLDIAGKLEAMGWQLIDTAPKDGSIIWVGSPSSLCPAYYYLDAWRDWYKGPRYENARLGAHAFAPEEVWFEPTHWQPVPKPPKGPPA